MTPAAVDAYVAAGSNVRPRENLRAALASLARDFPGLRRSRAFRNAAVGFEGDDFVNLVIALPTTMATGELIDRLKAVERSCGREPGAPKWGPRTLDLDLLLHGDFVGEFRGRRLPHPDIERRAWVLGPLAELAPHVAHPVSRETFHALWQRADRTAHPLEPVPLDEEVR
jgi:2-amino-4-hydroxy-6-hydroxymethyldihydropteridine diphosphokinase